MWFVTSQNDRTIPADQRPLVAKASNIVPGQHPQTRTTQEMARVIGTTAPARLVCRPRSWRDRPLRCGPSMRSELSQPYAVSVFSVTASAAFRITSSTKLGLDSIGTWLLSVSKVFAPIRFATKRSKAGWMVRSLLATMYQLGFDLQA